MFLFCVTRDSLARTVGTADQREFATGAWVVTIATDEWLSSCEVDPSGISVSEMPPFARAADARADLLFTEARFLADAPAIEITRTLIGGRQVYYHTAANGAFFCATHVRLLQAAGVRLEENEAAMAELFIYRYVTPPGTLFKNVDQLLAGQTLRFEFDGRGWRTRAERHYSPPRPPAMTREDPSNTPSRGAAQYSDGAGEALREAMLALRPATDQLHLLASGGLDSSILFRLVQSELGISESHSTAYPFEDDEHNIEQRYALTAAEALGARHRHFVPGINQFLRGAVEVVAIGEEPVIFTQSILLLLLFRHGLPSGDGVVVSGQGADGLYGLRLHHTIGNIERFKAAHPLLAFTVDPGLWSAVRPLLVLPPVASAMRAAVGRLVYDANTMDVLTGSRWDRGLSVSDPRHVLYRLGASHAEAWVLRRFSATRQHAIANRARAVEPFAGHDVLDALSLLDLLSDVSVSQAVWSKLGESARKIVYYPFNARPVIDCAFETPWEAKLAGPKAVLRDVARTLGIPEFIVTRPKANFNITTHNWAAPGGTFEPLMPLAAPVWERHELHEVRTRWRNSFTFWTMLNYAIWKRLFIEGESLDTLLEEIDYAGATDAPVRAAL